MNARTLSTLLLTLLITVPHADAKDLELRKKAGEYDVEIRIDRNPPILGDNKIEVEVKTAAGAPIGDANVLVNYYMPPMPRMAPMNYTTHAKPKGKKYTATMNLIMAGPWVIAVKIARDGKMTTAKFNIDAQ
ncbi:MAG: FixH family protein [Desulfobacterota bacterium]|jgi:hypothetical protein|nr:FixH family protein [Thermodesulfobacteriota bacterium]